MSAEYLFMTDKLYDISYDTGDKVIQCGRHNDIFKLWLQWRAKGTEGYGKTIDTLMDLALYQVRRIKAQPDKFYLILEPECVNVSFWYVPMRLRNVPHTAAKEAELAKVKIYCIYLIKNYLLTHFTNHPNTNTHAQICPIIKGKMMESGTLMVGYQPDDRRPNFFRSIISSAAVTQQDVDFMLNEIDRLGQDL